MFPVSEKNPLLRKHMPRRAEFSDLFSYIAVGNEFLKGY
jgi:hypothetical protein